MLAGALLAGSSGWSAAYAAQAIARWVLASAFLHPQDVAIDRVRAGGGRPSNVSTKPTKSRTKSSCSLPSGGGSGGGGGGMSNGGSAAASGSGVAAAAGLPELLSRSTSSARESMLARLWSAVGGGGGALALRRCLMAASAKLRSPGGCGRAENTLESPIVSITLEVGGDGGGEGDGAGGGGGARW
jgi:hypothetical protein